LFWIVGSTAPIDFSGTIPCLHINVVCSFAVRALDFLRVNYCIIKHACTNYQTSSFCFACHDRGTHTNLFVLTCSYCIMAHSNREMDHQPLNPPIYIYGGVDH
jgi:hypothetical protein